MIEPRMMRIRNLFKLPPCRTVAGHSQARSHGESRFFDIRKSRALPVCRDDPEVSHQTRGVANLRRKFRSDGWKIVVPARRKAVAGQQFPHLARREHSANRLTETADNYREEEEHPRRLV